MADFTPITFVKDGVTEVAYTWADYRQFIWDGWSIGPGVPEPPDTLDERLEAIESRGIIIASPTEPVDPVVGTVWIKNSA
jgi:hypothetical protein